MSDLTDAYRAHQDALGQPRPTLVALRRQIVRARNHGATWQQIGDELGLTRARAYEILNPRGGK